MEKTKGDLLINKGIILNSINQPPSRFGHTVNFISKSSVLIFGGAIETNNTFTMTSDTYSFNTIKNTWNKIEQNSSGPFPTARAAHATATVRENQILLYGGSIGNGRFASDDLWFLDIDPEKNICSCLKVSIDGASPGKRYGHSMIYLNPTLILFGGCKENEILNDFWILYTDKTPFKWIKIDPLGESPKPRVYHTANLFKYYHNEEMIVIFGGRDQANNSLSDIVGVRKNLNGEWEWCYFYDKYICESFRNNKNILDFGNEKYFDNNNNNINNPKTKKTDNNSNYSKSKKQVTNNKAEYGSFSTQENFANFASSKITQNSDNIYNSTDKNLISNNNFFLNEYGISLARQQHSCVFIGPFLFVVGGRTCTKDKARFDVFSMISLQWYNFGTLDFYRHTVWGFQNIKSVDEYDMYLYIYGGFIGETSKLNKDFIRIDVIELFSSIEILNNELDEYINNVINMEIEKSRKLKRMNSEPKNIFKLKDTVVMTKIDEINDVNNNVKNLSLNELPEESRRILEAKNVRNSNAKFKANSNGFRSVNGNGVNNVNGVLSKTINLTKLKNGDKISITHREVKDGFGIDEDTLKEFLDLMPLPMNFKPLNLDKNDKTLERKSIIKLLRCVKEEMMKTPTLIELQYPIKIFGSLNGQYNELINFFNTFGRPHEYKGDIDGFEYLFLGNMVNRGTFSLEVICLLFALKLKYPQSIHLIRGSNDDAEISNLLGLADECRYKLREDITKPDSVFKQLCEIFNYFPLAALIGNKILCVHSGIGPNVKSLEDIASIKKPYNAYKSEIILDLLWSSPVEYTSNEKYLGDNFTRELRERVFDEKMISEFFEKNKISYLIRSHSVLESGFEKLYDDKVFTIFSSSNYCEEPNSAGIIMINKSSKIQPKILAIEENYSSWFKSQKLLKKFPASPRVKKSN